MCALFALKFASFHIKKHLHGFSNLQPDDFSVLTNFIQNHAFKFGHKVTQIFHGALWFFKFL